jgi:hypothetical protein
VRLTTLPRSCAVVMKSEDLNFLESSGPLQACNGTALPLPLPFTAEINGFSGSKVGINFFVVALYTFVTCL